MTLPASAGDSTIELNAKAAAVVLRVPDGVAARIHAAGVIDLDTNRFPPHEDGYRSPDYETATNRVDIRAELPSGSLSVIRPMSFRPGDRLTINDPTAKERQP